MRKTIFSILAFIAKNCPSHNNPHAGKQMGRHGYMLHLIIVKFNYCEKHVH